MADEGMIEVEGGKVWYRRLGDGDALPVLLLHGGPGAAHDYMLPLAERLAEHRPAIVYDQLGCGRSDTPDDTSLWTVDRFVTEVDQVRAALGLDRCHLLGQSWGGWLAIDYMARGPEGVVGLVLASTSASIAEFVAGARGLIDDLPGAAPDGAHRARRARGVRPPRLSRGRAGVLPAPPVPARPVARRARAELDPDGGKPGLRDDERPDRVRRHRDPAHMGPAPRPGPDRRADARHVRALRRDHPGLLRDDRRGHPRREDGGVRGERPRRPPRGARGLRPDRGGVPGVGRGPPAV